MNLRNADQMTPTIKLVKTTFDKHKLDIKHIRETVFIKEQSVPPELEWDVHDKTALHLLVYVGTQAVATSRMLDDGHIGRMAVLSGYRCNGIGSRMLITLIDEAKHRGLDKVFLSAQVAAIPFYLQQGMVITSEEYMDAGIPHKDMALILP